MCLSRYVQKKLLLVRDCITGPKMALSFSHPVFFFPQVAVAVQYRVLEEGAYAAYYRLTEPRGQVSVALNGNPVN